MFDLLYFETRLISIDSHPKKVVVVIGLVVVHVSDVVVVVDPRNLPLNDGQNWVINRQELVVVAVFVVHFVVLLSCCLVKIGSITAEILPTLSSCSC